MDIRQFLKRKNDDEKKGSQEKKDEGENEDEHVSSKHASQSEESAPEQSASTGPAEPPPSKKPKPKKKNKGRGFREEWKLGRPWLKYDSSKGLMFCEICCGQNIQTKRGKLKESAFVKGCSNFKREAVEDHEKATTHTRAVEAHTNQQKPFEEKPAGQAWNALSKAKHISMMSWWHRILI